MMRTILPSETPIPDLHQLLIGAVSPRPIAFVSSISADGIPNLAPYSFFNVFSSHPPTLIFSSNRRVRGNTTKDTLHNVTERGEVVINVVSHAILRQMVLASADYPPEVSEFEKAGLTPLASEMVAPFRVKESPVQMECVVKQILPLGEKGGAGNLIICEMVRMHLDEGILDTNGRIDPYKIDLMGRMGRAYYDRASGSSVFPVMRAGKGKPIGMDQLPDAIRTSAILTGNELAQLAGVSELPTLDAGFREYERGDEHLQAKGLIAEGKIDEAWQVLLREH